MLRTICSSCMNPGHPFAREGQYNITIFELRSHTGPRRLLHPNECLPKDPEKKESAGGREVWRVVENELKNLAYGVRGYQHPSSAIARVLLANLKHTTRCGSNRCCSVKLLLVSISKPGHQLDYRPPVTNLLSMRTYLNYVFPNSWVFLAIPSVSYT